MQHATGLTVNRSISVDLPLAQAFALFADTSAWWPLDTHALGEKPGRASIVEPRAGGRWYQIDARGDEYGLGTVLAYEPPHRLVLTWDVSSEWTYDPSLGTEIEVRFFAETPARTRVDLEHRLLERYGEGARDQHALYEGEDAWTSVLASFAGVAATREVS